jgi:hypothetical protein
MAGSRQTGHQMTGSVAEDGPVTDHEPQEHAMPAQAHPHQNEAELLLGFIAQQRDGLRYAAYGLTDDQARLMPTAGTLSIGGLIKHVTEMERSWMDTVLQRQREASVEDQGSSYEDGFRLLPGETLEGALADLAAAGAETEAIVRELADLDRPVPVPKGVPWFPQDLDAWSLRWVLVHLVEEIGRHAGHGDIVRESIDGATMYELQAGAEGWPATDWIQPWTPPAVAAV